MRLLVAPLLAAVALALAAGAFAQEPSGDVAVAGDADCDGVISSIDAALILQFAAALIDALPCEESADITADGSINSIDASVILQIIAGLAPGIAPMSMAVEGKGAACEEPALATSCEIPAGAVFDLVVSLNGRPPTGYMILGTYVFHSGLYEPADDPESEVIWPDSAFAIRSGSAGVPPGVVLHGALSGEGPPFTISEYTGPVLRLTLRCPAEPGSFTIAMRPHDSDNMVGSGVGYRPSQADMTTVHPMQTIGAMDLDLNLDGAISETESNLSVGAVIAIDCV